MTILEKLEPYIDSYGLLAQTDGDGGDSAQRCGLLLTAAASLHHIRQIPLDELMETRWRFLSTVQWALISDTGLLRRHSNRSKWYGQWDRGSRDQYHIIIGMGLANCLEPLVPMLHSHARRLFLFTTNTRANTSEPTRWKLPDLTGPGFWAMWIRAFNRQHPSQGTLKTILSVLDLSMVVNSLIWRYYHLKFNKSHTDILNHTQVMIQSKISLDTPVAKLARWILRDAPIQEMFDDYFHPRTNGISEMATIYRPIIKWLKET